MRLIIDEDQPRPRTDARWIKAHCADCDLFVEAYLAPAACGDHFIATLRESHDRLHGEADHG